MTIAKQGGWDGVWVAPTDRATRGDIRAYTYVPRYDAAGLPAVIHRVGSRSPGTMRGVSEVAPLLPLARQVKGLIEAYVVGKRIQSCHPIFVVCEDPVAAAKSDRNGAVWGPNTVLEPGKTYYLAPGSDVKFPSFSFQGADLREFLDTLYRNQFAAVGYPVDVVLAQLTQTNMAASRSAWLQLYRQSERRQDAHIAQVCKPMDLVIIAEAVARGEIVIPAGMDLSDLAEGQYIRPVRSMPDPLKEAQAVAAWVELGRDKTSLWAESAGSDYRDSVVQRAEDDLWLAEFQKQPVPMEEPDEVPPGEEPKPDVEEESP
jgi:capsid protein